MHRPIIQVILRARLAIWDKRDGGRAACFGRGKPDQCIYPHRQEFEQRRPGTKVLFNFGGSGQLLQQIAKGAPVDVFASADQETMDARAKRAW